MANTTFNTTPQPTGIGLLKSNINTGTNQIGGILSSAYNAVRNFTGANDQPTPGTNYANPTRISTSTVPQSGLGAFNSTKTTSANGGSSTKPLSIPSVLVQQQALNKLGAGLVEDGIAGPKTTAAIAKYGTGNTTSSNNSSTSTPTTPTAKAPDDQSYQFRTDNGQPNTNWVNYKAPANPLTVAGAAPVVSASGGQTDQEKQTYAGLLNQSQNESPQVAAARQQLVDYNRQLAQTDKNISAQGISLDSARGQLANVGQAATAEEAALQGGVTNALTSQGQQITAGTAANTAAQTQAERATGAAENVLSAVAPLANTPYALNPATGTYAGSGVGNGTSAVDAVKNAGMLAGTQSGAAATAAAPGTTTAQNIITGGTATTNAANTGLQSSINNYVAANTAYSTATQQSKNLQTTMANTGINTNPQFANQAINTLQNQLGSANYTSFITALSEAQQAYTSLLSSVGAATPTINGQQATTIFNPNSTPAQINAAIDALNTAAYAKLQPLYEQIGTYASQLGGTSGSGTGAFSDSSFYGQQ